ADIFGPLGIHSFIVEQKALTQTSHGSVAQPGLTLVALRAVDRHSLVITTDTPEGIADNCVEYPVGSVYRTGMRHFIFHHFTQEIINGRLVPVSLNFNIAKTVVNKYRSPALARWIA